LFGFLFGDSLRSLLPVARHSEAVERGWIRELFFGRHLLKFGADYRRLAPFASQATPDVQFLYFSNLMSRRIARLDLLKSLACLPLYSNSPRLLRRVESVAAFEPLLGVALGSEPHRRNPRIEAYAIQGPP